MSTPDSADFPPNSTPAVKAPAQRERAYQALRRLLILQQIPSGQRLREPEWAPRLGVNRMALREAFARLEAEGLIEKGPKTGYFVPTLSDRDMRDILRIRAVLESAAIEEICASADRSPDRLKPLRDACDQFEALLVGHYLLGLSEADRRFHEALIDLADNRRLGLIYHRAPLPMIHAAAAQSDTWLQECRRTLAEHRAILAAIAVGDTDRAQALLREHLDTHYLLNLPR